MNKLIAKISLYAIGATLGIGRAFASSHEITNPIGSDTFDELLVRVAYYLFIFSIPVVSIMILWGAFQMLTAAGDLDKIKTAKKTITYAVVGFMVVILAMGAATVIKELVGVSGAPCDPSPTGPYSPDVPPC